MSWQPLLDGAAKKSALESVQAIVDDLSPFERRPTDDSLAKAYADLAILHGYLANPQVGRILTPPRGKRVNRKALPPWRGGDPGFTAFSCLGRALTTVADKPGSASLFGGLAGVGWAIAHLQTRLPCGPKGEDDLVEIDEVLLDHLDRSPWPDDYDLINGLVGFGVYALERLPRPAAVALLEQVIDRLAETAEQRADEVTWWTSPKWLPAETCAKFPRGYYNLGVAHGVPGVIALLGWACKAGVQQTKARLLLDGAVRWLLKQQGPAGFPYFCGPNSAENKTRLAWCYGDPGVAAALLAAAHCAEEPAWEQEALAIARRAAQCLPEESGVVDAGLCHGAAGLGHLFNRMFQATGALSLAEAARFWFERTLGLRQREQGVGGFSAWLSNQDGTQAWVADPGLLTGAAGIALALLAATSAVEPEWDRLLLVAMPNSAAV